MNKETDREVLRSNGAGKNGEKMADIDFVIPWVDGADPEWRKEKNRYENKENDSTEDVSKSDARYRDWDNLQYWFRAVEKYAPWVNKIHFVTWGHLPKWLNTKHPKLNIVKHEDYIPAKYLPTFSSHTIELNLFRIKGLSDRFVYFNDDIFLNRNVEEEDFFHNGMPRDAAALSVHCYSLSRPIQLISIRDVGVINEHFDMKKTIRNDIGKWFNIRYGLKNLRTLALVGSPRFPGFYVGHGPQAFLKSSFEEVWEAEAGVLDETCSHAFRQMTDVNQWVIKEWQLAKGDFVPRNVHFSSVYFLGSENRRSVADKAAADIMKHQSGMLCINDGEMTEEDFRYCTQTINGALASVYPQKSSYEL